MKGKIMGADFTYALCPRIVDRNTATARIRALSDERVLEIASDLSDDYGLDDDDTAQAAAQYREKLLADLEFVYDEHRDTALLNISGQWHVLTGGMSWGDEPTDSYRPLWRISETYATDTEENYLLYNVKGA